MSPVDRNSEKIAVLMAVHSGADPIHFAESLASIQSQTYSNFVIYLYCDGPLGASHQQVLQQSLLQTNMSYVVVTGETSVGLPIALNTLIDRALSDTSIRYFARMDADDISINTRFAKQVSYFLENPEVDVLGTWCIEFTDRDKPLFYKQLPSRPDQVGAFMLFRSPLAHPTVMFRRKVFENGSRYAPELLQAQDYELWSRLYCAGHRISNVPEYLLWYRLAKDFYARRSGMTRALAEFRMRLSFSRSSGQFKFWHVFGFLALFVIRIAPAPVKRFSYNHFRKS